MQARYIVHIDMDAFFAAVEQRDRPELRGKPVIVGSDPKFGKGRGVVATCSYEARKFGIHSAMPISTAYRQCPHAAFLPVDMAKYVSVSKQIFNIIYEFTPDIEPISVDEAFLDITHSYHLFNKVPIEACRQIKSRIKSAIGLTASVGLAPTKMVAKIASEFGKPDGLVEVTSDKLQSFLRPLDIRNIMGLGEKTQVILNRLGIKTIGQLASRQPEELTRVLGVNGYQLWQLANGIDEREVQPATEPRSISNEFTYDEDTADRKKIAATLMYLCEKVSGRLRQQGLKGRTVTLKIRLQGFETYTRTVTIPQPTNFDDSVYKAIKGLLDGFDCRGKKVRLLGVKVSNFIVRLLEQSRLGGTNCQSSEQAVQGELFGTALVDQRKEKLHQAIDKVKQRFGDEAIHRGTTILHQK